MARNMIARKTATDRKVTFDFTNGRRLVADVDSLPDDILRRLAVHGLSQKIGDSYASAGDKGWTVDDCADEAEAVYEALVRGEWNRRGSSGGTTILAAAIARVLDKDEAEVATMLNAMDDEKRKGIEKDARVKAAMAAIKAERAKAKAEAMAGGDGDGGTDLAGLFE